MKRSVLLGLTLSLVSASCGCATRNARPPVIRSAPEAGGATMMGSPGTEGTPQLTEQTPALPIGSGSEPNAAELYRQAIALYKTLPSDEWAALLSWQDELDAEKEKRLCEKTAAILDLMQAAAAVTNCDWGITGESIQASRLALSPYLHGCDGLCRVTIWSAAHCHADDSAEAANDLVLGLQLITHRMPQIMRMCFLVSASVHNRAAACIAENGWRFSLSDRARLIEALNDPQFEENLYLAIDQEGSLPLELMDGVESNLTAKAITPSAEAVTVMNSIRETGELQKEFVTALSQSEDEYQKWLDRVRTAEASNRYIQKMREETERAVDLGRAALVRRAMVAAGMAVLQSGPSALSNYPDPATGQPFRYQEDADEFQLESGFQFRDNPITLTFRRRNSSGN